MKSSPILMPFCKIEIAVNMQLFSSLLYYLQMEGAAVVSSSHFGYFVMHRALEMCVCVCVVYLRGVTGTEK